MAKKTKSTSKAAKAARKPAKKSNARRAPQTPRAPKAAPRPKSAPRPKPAPSRVARALPEQVEPDDERESAPPPPAAKAPPALLTPRATVRSPARAEELKAKLGKLASASTQIRTLKRSLQRSFYDIGQILRDMEQQKLYEAKGYSSFEAFVEREMDLGRQLSLKLVRIVKTFLREAAIDIGLDRLSAAVDVLDGDLPPPSPASDSTPPSARSPIPLHKQ